MKRRLTWIFVTTAVMALAACSSGSEVGSDSDASKLDPEITAQALEIEQRANAAADRVTQEAQAELERVESETRAAAQASANVPLE